jgi:enolase
VETILQAIEKAGYKPGEEICLAFDALLLNVYKDGKYDYTKSSGEKLTSVPAPSKQNIWVH